jgi:hypothetical protein
MKLRAYSSLTAFLAHYAALRAARSARAEATAPTSDDAATLTAMEELIEELSESDRAALRDDPSAPSDNATSSGAAERHRARAELKLHRLLTARGMLAG